MKKGVIAAVVVILLILAGILGGDHYYRETLLEINGATYPKDTQTLKLSGESVTDVRAYAQLTELKQLDLRDVPISTEDYEYLQSRLPACEILWLLPFQGRYLPLDTASIAISGLTDADRELLAYLPELQAIDATACRDYAMLLDLQSKYPDCKVRYSVPLGGQEFPESTNLILLPSASAAELEAALPWLPQVTKVVVTQPMQDYDTMLQLREAYPQIHFTYRFELLGKTLCNWDTQLDFSGIQMESADAIEACMPHFTQLEKVEMCECGIPDEEMDALNRRWPDTLFVWTIHLGRVTLRTDITYFMPWQYRYQVTDADADKLKYLTELICLDFGHMDISRTDYLAYMPKLQYLLMCDTPITDISACANLTELKYVELFMTDVTDFSPLLECENLVDLNICYTYPSDFSVLCQMTQLENLWFRGLYNERIQQMLREALPDTRMVFGRGSSTGAGWRELENYYNQRDILGMSYMTD